ncbi:MAG: SGNH/GDSL hydrolase family protein, partial [Segetibacter sp.]
MKKLVLLLVVACMADSFTKKEITWVAIGDSITYLNEHLNETGNRITRGYMTRVVEKLPNIHYVNQGHNGWTS